MNSKSFLTSLSVAALLAGTSIMSMPEAKGQQGGPPERRNNAVKCMQAKDWGNAIIQLDAAIKAFENNQVVKMTYGDKFAEFFYLRGVCQLSLGQYEQAVDSFKACMSKYKSAANEYQYICQYKIAEAMLALKNYDEALKALKAYIAIRGRVPMMKLSPADRKLNLGLIYTLAAQCCLRKEKPDFNEGVKFMKQIAKNRYKGEGIPDEPIMNTFRIMVDQSLKQDKPEVALDFLKDGRSVVALEPWRMTSYLSPMLSLASQARSKMLASTGDKAKVYGKLYQQLLSLVPNSVEIDQNTKDVVKRLGTLKGIKDTFVTYDKAAIQEKSKAFAETLKSAERHPDALTLMLSLSQYTSAGAYRQAKAAYKILNDEYASRLTPEMQEQNLYAFMMICAQLGEMQENQALAKEFMTKYPNSKYNKSLSTVAISSAYTSKKYDDVLAQAKAILATNPTDETVRETVMFFDAAAAYQTRRYKEAIAKVQKYVDEFGSKDSKRLQTLMYYIASAQSRLGNKDVAITEFNKFTDKYKATDAPELYPFVLYERALCLANKQDNKDAWNLALKDLDTLINDFSNLSIYKSCLLNKAILLNDKLDKPEEAEPVLKTALAEDDKKTDVYSRSEILFNLMKVAKKSKDRDADVVAFYDQFYPLMGEKQVYSRLLAARDGMESMDKVGRGDEGLKRMQEAIVAEAQLRPESPLLEAAMNAYTKQYVDKVLKKADKKAPINLATAKDNFYNFPNVKEDDYMLIALLRMALVGVYEDELQATDKSNSARVAEIDAAVKAIFTELQKSFKLESLGASTLIKIGTYLVNSDRPEMAVPYFDEILKRGNDPKNESEAVFGKAQALAASGDSAHIGQALDMMNKALVAQKSVKNPDPHVIQRIDYNIIKFTYANKDYKKAADLAYEYLKDTSTKKENAPQVSYLWAQAYDQLGDIDMALTGYQRINANYTGNIKISAPAVKRLMELFVQRNKGKADLDSPSDKYLAYTTGARYSKLTTPLLDKMSLEDKGLWRATEAKYRELEKDSAIMDEDKATKQRALEKKKASK